MRSGAADLLICIPDSANKTCEEKEDADVQQRNVRTVTIFIIIVMYAGIISSCSFSSHRDMVTDIYAEPLPEDSRDGPYDPIDTIAKDSIDEPADCETMTETTPEETTAGTETDDKTPKATIKRLLSAAVEPAGRCLYIWGGGWNETDSGAGIEAMTFGLSPRWLEFFRESTSDYDYHHTRYQIHDGLDCSGFVGYAVYQVFGDRYRSRGYVFNSGKLIKEYEKLFGGTVTDSGRVTDYTPGDIMGRDGHVFIVIGECSDGSVLFIHASPPAVSLCGTPSTDGRSESDAVKLARKYMSEYRSECYEKFDTCARGSDFLKGYDQYRWDAGILADPDGYRAMDASDIISDLFSE